MLTSVSCIAPPFEALLFLGEVLNPFAVSRSKGCSWFDGLTTNGI
jgi:hypothetical protein